MQCMPRLFQPRTVAGAAVRVPAAAKAVRRSVSLMGRIIWFLVGDRPGSDWRLPKVIIMLSLYHDIAI